MKLKPSSLDWAKKHVLRDGDTDLFPIPFEFSVIKKSWASIRPALESIDINQHHWGGARRLLVPKSEFAFRPITQLDPLDSILFAGVIKEIGRRIENRRRPASDRVVFSYRFDPKPNGQLYSADSGWEDFWLRSAEHCATFGTVLVTDISDWYNQIYHHTIENQLDEAGVDKGYWYALKNLTASVSEGVSRGIPIGPHPSHLLAELAMAPIDEFISSVTPAYCRYVDDIHIFCATEGEARKILYKLAEHLDKTQKIQLNRRKTKIFSSAEFATAATANAADKPISNLEREMLNMVKSYARNPYEHVPIETVKATDLSKLSQTNIESVLQDYLSESPVDYIRLRWFIRRLAQVGAAGGVEFVVRHFSDMLPAMAEVGRYLEVATKNYTGSWSSVGNDLLSLYQSDVVQASEYLKVVILSLFARISGLNHINRLTSIYQSETPMCQRKIVLAAANAGLGSWLSSMKGDFKTSDAWQRRALLYSMRALPNDERTFWLKSAKKRLAGLDALIADSIA